MQEAPKTKPQENNNTADQQHGWITARRRALHFTRSGSESGNARGAAKGIEQLS
jgi:hypothetical protein